MIIGVRRSERVEVSISTVLLNATHTPQHLVSARQRPLTGEISHKISKMKIWRGPTTVLVNCLLCTMGAVQVDVTGLHLRSTPYWVVSVTSDPIRALNRQAQYQPDLRRTVRTHSTRTQSSVIFPTYNKKSVV